MCRSAGQFGGIRLLAWTQSWRLVEIRRAPQPRTVTLMPSPQHRINQAFDLLIQGVSPFVERELQACYRDNWQEAARSSFRDDRGIAINKGETIRWDTHSLLTVMWDQWNGVFRHKLGFLERSLVSELREYRNRWAHQTQFGFEDTYRILDSVERLLTAVGASEAETVRRERQALMQEEVSEELNRTSKALLARRNFAETLAVYIICAAALSYQTLQWIGPSGWTLVVLIVVLFALLTYKRLQPQPLSLGPHECPRCHRIIYTTLCPYCQPGSLDVASESSISDSKASRVSRDAAS